MRLGLPVLCWMWTAAARREGGLNLCRVVTDLGAGGLAGAGDIDSVFARRRLPSQRAGP